MKFFLSIIIIGFSMSFISCRNTHAYEKYIKELDSLKVVLQQSVDNFKTVDSAVCNQAYITQHTYSQFIESHLKDTVTKNVAENLQIFHSVEKGIESYVKHRSSWLNDAQLSINQLQTLSFDLKNGSIDAEEAIEFINEEKNNQNPSLKN